PPPLPDTPSLPAALPISHRTSVPRFGGRPYIRTPIRKIFAAAHAANAAVNADTAIAPAICQSGTGSLPALAAIRCTITKGAIGRSEEHTSELQSPDHLVC